MKNKTKGIGFKNFRRFEDFPVLEFGDITYLVGRNNSGKSTMVKAQLLIMDYLQNQLYNTFSFDNEVLEDANIVTFGRAKNNKSKSNQIEFTTLINGVHFSVTISADDNATKANVLEFKIIDNYEGIILEIDYSKKEIHLKQKKKRIDSDNRQLFYQQIQLNEDLKDVEYQISLLESRDFKQSLRLKDKRNSLLEQINKITKAIPQIKKGEESYDFSVTYPLQFLSVGQMFDVEEDDENEYKIVFSEDNMIKEFISIVLYFNNIQYKNDIEISKNNSDNEFNPDSIEVHQNKIKLQKWANWISNHINEQVFYYIPANPSKQTALFSLRDKNNDLAQAIHHFKQAGLDSDPESKKFVKYWMNEFEVGEDFSIEFYAGEAYEFHVFEDGAQNHLSDKGMGSLQIMSLILKLAVILFDKPNNHVRTSTVLIEEPELNLHPELQSKLSDFLLEVSKKNVQFLVETHSEYIIRKAQLIAIQEDYISNYELNPNPFKIFYFHKEEGPYEMKFNSKGKFERDFGPGFYNEAGSLTMKMIKELRKKQAK
ncbi:AAA family ATPase [uncultured Polaribacter sp.]|uniref:AAA family ATPase n=1 Tax=uncultured Polaribacter sp. TaxID=174711 RepID=UPI00259BAFAF|nr:AAA family ATPase [uncultured Polaribacter sp.]